MKDFVQWTCCSIDSSCIFPCVQLSAALSISSNYYMVKNADVELNHSNEKIQMIKYVTR